MKAYDKEFYEAMILFEKVSPYGCKLDKAPVCGEDDNYENEFYFDGRTNELFKMFLHGYADAKRIYMT